MCLSGHEDALVKSVEHVHRLMWLYHNALPFSYVTDVVQGFLLAAYHQQAPGNGYNISNDRPLTQLEMFTAIADAVGGVRPRLHVLNPPIYYGSMVAERVVARLMGAP